MKRCTMECCSLHSEIQKPKVNSDANAWMQPNLVAFNIIRKCSILYSSRANVLPRNLAADRDCHSVAVTCTSSVHQAAWISASLPKAMRQEFPLITKQEFSILLRESVMVGASVQHHPQISDAVLKSTELQIRLRQVESLLLCAARIEDQLPGAVHRNAVYTFEKKPLVFVLL
jgi:hypothetical protein